MSSSNFRNSLCRLRIGLHVASIAVVLQAVGCKSLTQSDTYRPEAPTWPSSLRKAESIPQSGYTSNRPELTQTRTESDTLTASKTTSQPIVRGQSPQYGTQENRYVNAGMAQPPSTSVPQLPAVLQTTPGNTDAFRAPMQPSGEVLPSANSPMIAPSPTTNYSPVQPPVLPDGSVGGGPVLNANPYGQPFPNEMAQPFPGAIGSGLPPLDQPWQMQPNYGIPPSPSTGYQPRVRNAPVDIYAQEAQTGKFVFGGSVNTDLGFAGQVVVEERNFDIRKLPTSWSDLFNGAFRGNGENFRLELMPGNRVQRYSVNWTQPNLFGYSPWNLALGGYYFNRIYRDWDEQRLGARGMLGYQITPDLSFSTELRGENVKMYNPRILGVPALDSVLGSHELYTGRLRLAHNTRDSVFLPTEGHFLELIYDQVFGSFDYPRGQINYSKYFLIRERADGGGRHTLTSSWKFGFSGEDTPLFENFFAGGFTTMRGFSFRGASPVEGGVQVGGRFMFLGSLEYMFPLTADDMLRMVAFVDYGTIENNIEVNSENFRVAPGLGFRIAVPALGPGPLAFDFAYPVSHAETDDRQVFSFSVGITR